MWNIKEFKKENYKPKDVAMYLGVTSRTISKYCEQGLLEDIILETGRRIIPKESLIDYLDKKGLIDYTEQGKIDVVYARVSTHKQKNRGDLDRQIEKCLAYAATRNPKNLKVYKEVSSGLNDSRKEFIKLINSILKGEIDRIFISYKDRLTRFGFNYIETMCKYNDTQIVVISSEEQDKIIEEELAEDLIAIIHSFSVRLYGLRGKVKKAIEKEIGDKDQEVIK